MALIVEDGTLVANADSYISLADAKTYAALRGISLSATDATADIQLRKAFDYLESLRSRYKGAKSDSAQLTQWPRKCVWVDGEELSSATIPTSLQYAQVQYAAAINSGVDLAPVSDGGAFITRETVGPITTEYSDKIGSSGVPTIRAADALLEPLMLDTGPLTVVRA